MNNKQTTNLERECFVALHKFLFSQVYSKIESLSNLYLRTIDI